MDVEMTRKSKALYRGSLMLAMVLCTGTEGKPTLTSVINSVHKIIANQSTLPFCYTTTLFDLTCFWESNTSDVSTYTFYYTRSFTKTDTCNLTTAVASNDTWWHICLFPPDTVDCFSETILSVKDNRANITIYNRIISTEHVVLVKLLQNITVTEQTKPLGLLVSVAISKSEYFMYNSFTYQVNYSSTESEIQKSVLFDKVDTEHGYAKLFLNDLISSTEYTISVRVKLDDGVYKGYWSDWSVVTFQTSKGIDELHIVLFVIAGLIPVAAIALVYIYHGRFLKSKVWPKIPSPEHHFKELYTTHKGNFKLWLGQTDPYLMWISRNIFPEGSISTLEVLSELPSTAASLPSSAQLLPKDSYVILDENMLPHFPAWAVAQRQVDAQREQPSAADVPSQEKTLIREARPQGSDCVDDLRVVTNEEEPALQESKRGAPTGVPGCRNVLREDSLDLDEGSPGSSFEYTVLETCDGLLSPRTRSIPPRQPLKYAYLLMSDSGKESPPPSPNIYQNSLCAQFPAPVYSEC